MPANPPEKYRFKPGQSGNPLGGKAHNPAMRGLKKLTTESYCELIGKIAHGETDEVMRLAKDLTGDNLLGTLAACWMKARAKGDYETIEKILSRVLGKVPEHVNVIAQTMNTNLNAEIDNVKVKAALKALEDKI